MLLDSAACSRAESLGLLARRIVEGYRVGDHRSPLHGFAIEFSQHREYQPGDDPRHLDWKILGKTDRLYLKRYEQDTNYVAHLLVDSSASMGFGSGAVTKSHYARALSATLAYAILRQRDAVTLAVFSDRVLTRVERTDSPGRLDTLLSALVAHEPAATGDLPACLARYAPHVRSRGIIVVVSDFLDDPALLAPALRRLALSRSEIILMQVLDPAELRFEFDGEIRFIGLEDLFDRTLSPADVRTAYLEAFHSHQAALRRLAEQLGADLVTCDTGRPLADTLAGYLASRARRR